MLNRSEKHTALFKQPVTADHINSKRYFIKDSKPTDDQGDIGDICFVFNLEPPEPPEPEVLSPFDFIYFHQQDTLTTRVDLKDVFTTDYKNYVVEISSIGNDRSVDLFLRWLDDSYAEIATVNFTTQELGASGDGTSGVFGQQYTKNKAKLGETSVDNGTASGLTAYIYDPLGTGPTAIRTTGLTGRDGVRLLDYASICDAGSYKSFAVTTTDARQFKGSISVYGVRS